MRVCIVYNAFSGQAAKAASGIRAHLSAAGVRASALDADGLRLGEGGALPGMVGRSFDLVVSLGGDGTLLKAARVARPWRAPVLGLNYGHLGFLANECADPAGLVDRALRGLCAREERTCLEVAVSLAGGAAGDARTLRRFALNEVVVSRAPGGGLLEGVVSVDGRRVLPIEGDGVVLSTATGSTAYALSAGGPIVSPGFDGIEVVPLASRDLRARCLCAGAGEAVGVSVIGPDAECFVDGEPVPAGGRIRSVEVRCADDPVVLLFDGSCDFFDRVSRTFFS